MKRKNSVKVNKVILVNVLTVLFLAGSVGAVMQQGSDMPRITIEELKAMMDKGTRVTIIDAQPAATYAEGHIKGAISLPWKSEISLDDVFSLPGDVPIVIYCDCGPGESDSADVAAQLMRMGYDDVKVLKDPSIKGWKKAGYPLQK